MITIFGEPEKLNDSIETVDEEEIESLKEELEYVEADKIIESSKPVIEEMVSNVKIFLERNPIPKEFLKWEQVR